MLLSINHQAYRGYNILNKLLNCTVGIVYYGFNGLWLKNPSKLPYFLT